jgi:hypothetical protein
MIKHRDPLPYRLDMPRDDEIESFPRIEYRRVVGGLLIVLALALITAALTGCVSDSIQYDPATHVINAQRTAVLTNIGDLHFSAEKMADGSVKANVDESKIDQTTAALQAITTVSELALKAAAKP